MINLFIIPFLFFSILNFVSFSIDDPPFSQRGMKRARDLEEPLPLELFSYEYLPEEIWPNIFSSISAEAKCYVKLSSLSHAMNRLAKELFKDTAYFFLITDNSCAQYIETFLHEEPPWHFPNIKFSFMMAGFRAGFFKSNLFLTPLLFKNNTLRSLDLSGNQLCIRAVQALSQALKINKTLTSLDLCLTYIDNEGIQTLSQSLKINTTLTCLHLCLNNIGNEGAQILSQVLHYNTRLTYLNLMHTQIYNDGAKALLGALQNNKTLKILNLESNYINNEIQTTDFRVVW